LLSSSVQLLATHIKNNIIAIIDTVTIMNIDKTINPILLKDDTIYGGKTLMFIITCGEIHNGLGDYIHIIKTVDIINRNFPKSIFVIIIPNESKEKMKELFNDLLDIQLPQHEVYTKFNTICEDCCCCPYCLINRLPKEYSSLQYRLDGKKFFENLANPVKEENIIGLDLACPSSTLQIFTR